MRKIRRLIKKTIVKDLQVYVKNGCLANVPGVNLKLFHNCIAFLNYQGVYS